MLSRAAILTVLVLGFLLPSSDASLAISGMADNDQAAVAQYPGPSDIGSKEVVLAADSESGGTAGQEAAQTMRQIQAGVEASGGGRLPFSGFAAIPVLVIGLCLGSAGVVLRRSARRG